MKIYNTHVFSFSPKIISLAHLSTHNCTEYISLHTFVANVSPGAMLVIGSCNFQFVIPSTWDLALPPTWQHSYLPPSTGWAPTAEAAVPLPWIGSHKTLRDRSLRSLLPGHQARLPGIIQLKIDKGFISRSIEKKQIVGTMIKVRDGQVFLQIPDLTTLPYKTSGHGSQNVACHSSWLSAVNY